MYPPSFHLQPVSARSNMTEATVISSGVELDIAKTRVGILSEENDRLQNLVSTLKTQLQASQTEVRATF